MMFLLSEIAVSLDNIGKETAHSCASTETKITCSHVFVDEILGTWRARSPPKMAHFSDVWADFWIAWPVSRR